MLNAFHCHSAVCLYVLSAAYDLVRVETLSSEHKHWWVTLSLVRRFGRLLND